MGLSDLDIIGRGISVVLLQTPCEPLKLFVQDKIKSTFECDINSIIDIRTSGDIRRAREMVGIEPFLSSKWLFICHFDKLSNTDIKELSSVIKENQTGVFYCLADRYPTYKYFKGLNKDVEGFLDFYITYLRRADFLYLYDNLVPESNTLPKTIYDYVVSSYSSDLDEVFKLFRELQSGTKVQTRRDVTSICGLGGNTIDNFVLSLLRDPPTTAKGSSTVIRNRVKAGIDLSNEYSWGQIWGYSLNTVRCLSDIKMLYISGAVYKSLRDIPEGYDSKRLMRYSRYLWKLRDIPFSRIVRLRSMLDGQRWGNEFNFIEFIYKYYKDLILKEVL